jgi:AcrR family transcriptional regulator
LSEGTSTKARILQAGYEEISLHGVLGFRLIDVADRATTVVSMIHRHFGSREGLIQAVFEMVISANVKRISQTAEQVRSNPDFTIEDALVLLYRPSSQEGRMFRWFRIQALASSVSDPVLKQFMMQATTEIHHHIKDLIVAIRAKLNYSAEIDLDASAQLWSTIGLMLITDDHLLKGKLSDERFLDLIMRVLLQD